MSRRFWKRLAGCIAINCALAADPEYQAGVAVEGPARAVVLKDKRGRRAVIVDAEFPVTRAFSDLVSVQLLKSHDLDRAAMVFRGAGTNPANPDAIVAAVATALHHLEPATVTYDGVTVSLRTASQDCLAALPRGPCAGGNPVRSPIRAAFQIVEPDRGLQKRGETRAQYPVQAIALGREVVILALGGAAQYPMTKGLVLLPFANDTATPPENNAISAAIRRVLSRVGR